MVKEPWLFYRLHHTRLGHAPSNIDMLLPCWDALMKSPIYSVRYMAAMRVNYNLQMRADIRYARWVIEASSHRKTITPYYRRTSKRAPAPPHYARTKARRPRRHSTNNTRLPPRFIVWCCLMCACWLGARDWWLFYWAFAMKSSLKFCKFWWVCSTRLGECLYAASFWQSPRFPTCITYAAARPAR